jgi:hypothetical protein
MIKYSDVVPIQHVDLQHLNLITQYHTTWFVLLIGAQFLVNPFIPHKGDPRFSSNFTLSADAMRSSATVTGAALLAAAVLLAVAVRDGHCAQLCMDSCTVFVLAVCAHRLDRFLC